MARFIETFGDAFEYFEIGALVLLVVLALGRAIYKTIKGESITIPSVGISNDLPSSVTGINKHNDIEERMEERRDSKTERE